MNWLQRQAVKWLGIDKFMAEKRAEIVGPALPQFAFTPEFGLAPPRNYNELVSRNGSWVYACIQKRQAAAASVPLRAFVKTRNGERQTKRFKTRSLTDREYQRLWREGYGQKAERIDELEEYPLLDLWKQVNPYMNGHEMIELIVGYQDLIGAAYQLVVEEKIGGRTRPTQLWMPLAHLIRIVPSKQNFIDHYLYGQDIRTAERFSRDEIIRYTLPNPNNLFYGLGPTEAGKLTIDLNLEYTNFETSMIKNGMNVDLFFSSPQRMLKAQEQEIEKELSRNLRGSRFRKNWIFLRGDLKVQEAKRQIRDMAYLKGREFSQTEIAAIYGVPEGMLKVQNVNKANADAGMIMFRRDTIKPILKRIEQKLNEQLVPRFDPSGRLFVAFDDPVPEDRAIRTEEIRERLNVAYSSINEERAEDRKAPVPWGDVPYIPIQNQPPGTTLPNAVSGQGADEKPKPKPKEDDEKTFHACGHDHKELDTGEGHLFPMTSDEKALANVLRGIGREQRKEVLGKIERNRSFAKADSDLAMAAAFLLDQDKWTEFTAIASSEILERMYAERGSAEAQRLSGLIQERLREPPQFEIGFDIQNPFLKTAVDERVFKFAFAVTAETNSQLRSQLLTGIMAGESPKALKARVAGVFEDLETWRAERISRTESAFVLEEANMLLWQSSGVVEAVVWRKAPGACEFCEALDGKTISIGSVFASKGDAVEGVEGGKYNLTFTDITHPPLHVNCRCATEAVLKSIEELEQITA